MAEIIFIRRGLDEATPEWSEGMNDRDVAFFYR